MSAIAIAKNELRRLFTSPLAWLSIAVIQVLLCVFFFTLLYQFMQPAAVKLQHGLTETVVVGVIQTCGVLMMIICPIMTMRLFSDELRTGTIDLLLSSPISITQIVLGKYLGTLCFMFIIALICASMLLSLNLGTRLDSGLFVSAFLGLCLLIALFVAIGMFMSSLTPQATVAAVCSFVVSFMLWIVHIAATDADSKMAALFSYLSVLKHFNQLLRGLISSTDISYFILLTTLFLVLTVWRLDARLVLE